MLIEMCRAKIGHLTITEAELHYEGSVTVDSDLLDAVGMFPGEKVDVLNVHNGQRFSTYTIKGKAGSGQVCLNGPAARLGMIGDKIMIVSYCLLTPEEAKNHQIKVIHVDQHNKKK